MPEKLSAEEKAAIEKFHQSGRRVRRFPTGVSGLPDPSQPAKKGNFGWVHIRKKKAKS